MRLKLPKESRFLARGNKHGGSQRATENEHEEQGSERTRSVVQNITPKAA